jgi:hypothetical protein
MRIDTCARNEVIYRELALYLEKKPLIALTRNFKIQFSISAITFSGHSSARKIDKYLDIQEIMWGVWIKLGFSRYLKKNAESIHARHQSWSAFKSVIDRRYVTSRCRINRTERVQEGRGKRKEGRTSEWINEWMNEWMSEATERMAFSLSAPLATWRLRARSVLLIGWKCTIFECQIES